MLHTSSISEHLRKVLGAYSKMQMVIYGIGSFESCMQSALQLGLAILMQRDFKWIGIIQVFDPILSATECRILEALGCSVLTFNEHGRKRALEPTLFFMPGCPFFLYSFLLEVNWNPDMLSRIVIFGGNFNHALNELRLRHTRPMSFANRFANEFIVTTRNPRIPFIHGMSWIFFDLEQKFMNKLPHLGSCISKEVDLQVYSWTEMRLKEKIERHIKNLERSQFYHNLQDKLQAMHINQHVDMVMMGSKSKMKMIICDIGSIETSKTARMEISFALLMKKSLNWIGDIQVYQQFISATECQVFRHFGCSILSFDRYKSSWKAIKPTMFFVPHLSSKSIYDNVLEANWKSCLLKNILWCGYGSLDINNTSSYMDLEYSVRYTEAAKSFTKAFKIKTSRNDFCRTNSSEDSDSEEAEHSYELAFQYLTWLHFNQVDDAELQFMKKFLQKGCYVSYM